MLFIAFSFLLGLGLIAWGVRLLVYKHPPDYTEGVVTIASSTSAENGSFPRKRESSITNLDPGSEAGMTAREEDLTVTLEGHTFAVDLADTMEKRAAGLSGRERLKDNEGMLFIFPSAGTYGFWMKDMRFDIDIVWISAGRVVGVADNVPAPRAGESTLALPSYYPPEPVDTVLEISAGLAAKYGIGAGDQATFGLQK